MPRLSHRPNPASQHEHKSPTRAATPLSAAAAIALDVIARHCWHGVREGSRHCGQVSHRIRWTHLVDPYTSLSCSSCLHCSCSSSRNCCSSRSCCRTCVHTRVGVGGWGGVGWGAAVQASTPEGCMHAKALGGATPAPRAVVAISWQDRPPARMHPPRRPTCTACTLPPKRGAPHLHARAQSQSAQSLHCPALARTHAPSPRLGDPPALR
jgi:hypothetical protein